jgi:hypothetical protein
VVYITFPANFGFKFISPFVLVFGIGYLIPWRRLLAASRRGWQRGPGWLWRFIDPLLNVTKT